MKQSVIKTTNIPKTPKDRTQKVVQDLLDINACIDVHTHYFDKHCTSAHYIVMRFVRDFFGFRSGEESSGEAQIERIYEVLHDSPENWDMELNKILEKKSSRGGIDGILFKILRMNKMEEVYDYYLKDSSLAKCFGGDDHEVITTVLMMDFLHGWGVKTKKSLKSQIDEIKDMAKRRPVLPFLFCDPRRAENFDQDENLYELFEYAFTGDVPFFGVKLYPSLGYHPNDYRLWPIYEICCEYDIPVLTHCGGETVSTNDRSIDIYDGHDIITIQGKKRKHVAYQLNNPAHWESALKEFPNLKVNLAHFGSDDTWRSAGPVGDKKDAQHRKEKIFELMQKYDGVYADFSYTITNPKATNNFVQVLMDDERVRERSMFGSDYWVVHKEGELCKHQAKFLRAVEQAESKLKTELCKTNPKRYLFEVMPEKEFKNITS